MDSTELNERLVAVGEKLKSKGWESASIDISVSYLAIFDREPGPLDPMIYCRPSIRASTRNRFAAPSTHQFVSDPWDVKTLEQALAKLEAAADDMPRMADEVKRIEMAKSKLSEDERRLLGVR